MEHGSGKGRDTAHACSHTVMLCQCSLPFRATVLPAHGAGPPQAMSAARSDHCHRVALGDHCGLLSTNADDFSVVSAFVLRSTLSKS